jgi:ubiquinone biosynthesis protein
MVLYRLVAWSGQLSLFFLANLRDTILRRDSVERRAVRLRHTLQKMGPAAIKVGQQLSVRADFIRHEYCDELNKMLDQVPPFPGELAIRSVEKAIGRTLGEVFAIFDPVPIGSASLACVYQARLHTGELVAVKVKRPDIGIKLATDLKAISWLCIAAEALGIIRYGLTNNFRQELWRMLIEELDFCLEARYTEIFRRAAKKNKYVSAPRVYHHLSDFDVLVTEFISGVFLNEIIYALENDDQETLRAFRARGFRPKKISRRMLQVLYWEFYESHFFHADPHPANIIIKPDNTMIMIDFGSCGAISNRSRRKILSFNRHMAAENVQGMVQDTISMVEPLPPIDVEHFSNEMMNIYRDTFVAHKSKNAPWYDKCTGGAFMKIIGLTQKYNVPMTLDTVRVFRANFMYDSITYRLNPKLDPQKEFKRWAKGADRRARKRAMGSVRDRLLGPASSDFTKLEELSTIVDSGLNRLQHYLDRPDYNFVYSIGKMAYVFSTIVKNSIFVFVMIMMLAVLRMFHAHIVGSPAESGTVLLNAIKWALNNKVVIACLIIYSLVTIRKVLFRVEDLDVR